ncbi:MAG: hypothetical protein HOV79_30120 [Hamadaea sp.]|nr:hypothetical protein [Hamadaea sp.]
MILNAIIHREWKYAETSAEMAVLVTQVMEDLRHEGVVTIGGLDYPTAGETARLAFSENRHSGEYDWPAKELVVAVNTETGYGALTWRSVGTVAGGDLVHETWVSENPEPPEADPRVVADPHVPTFHDRRNALPLMRIREALEEYCRVGTGDRPRNIAWTRPVNQRV